MITSHAPGVELADYILAWAARAADRPRPIDRYIDYFGGALERAGRDETVATERVAG
jgi:hypothetical protein